MNRRVEPVRLLSAPLLTKRDETRAKRTVPRRLAIDSRAHDPARQTGTTPDQVRGRLSADHPRAALFLVKVLVRGAGPLWGRGRGALEELRRVTVPAVALVVTRRARRALARIAADLALQLDDVEEDVPLP